ncbi:sn-glycerol-3-phosphate transport system permease protein UgpA [Dickeya solani]|nr:sn-glycerol-3-phosphate transport system permease protein UgpA [Dickeya solani]
MPSVLRNPLTGINHHHAKTITMRKNWLPWVILSPSLLFLLLFTYFPLLRSVYDSLFDTRMAGADAPFVGLGNVVRLLNDAVFWRALFNNLVYILLTVIPGVVLALLLAVALWENHTVNRWLRTAFFFPMIIPMVSAAALWLFIFMPGIGLLDYYLAKLFGPMNNNYLGRSNSALLALALIGVWKFAGYYMLFFLAGLQSIPPSTREAAIMEGASPTQVFFRVTLPLLRPTLSFVITTALIYSITQIDHVAVMTHGGPDNATTVLLYYIQNLAWDTHDLGKASAATFLTLAGLFVFSLINLKVLEKGAHYER